MKRWSVGLVLASIAVLARCSATGSGAAPAAGPTAVPVVLGTVVSRDVPVQWRGIGTVEAPQSVEMRSRVGGTLVEVRFREGEDVARGAVLFVIDRRPYQARLAEAEALQARVQVTSHNADQEAGRYADLVEQGYVTRQDYEAKRAAADAAQAGVAAAAAALEQARLNLDWCTLVAPMSGRTGSLLIHAGNLIEASGDEPLVVIHQVEPILVRFAVPQAYLAEVARRRASGEISAEAAPRGAALPLRVGQVSFVDNAVDPATGTLALKASFPNADRALWPGQLVDVVLTLSIERAAVVVPARAIQTGRDGDFAYVAKPDNTVELRAVTIRRPLGDDMVVGQGLEPGQQVVVEGQLRLVPGASIAPREPA